MSTRDGAVVAHDLPVRSPKGEDDVGAAQAENLGPGPADTEAGTETGADAAGGTDTPADRSPTRAAAAVLAQVAPPPARTWTVADVLEPPALAEPDPLAERGSRLAVLAAAVVLIAVLGGFGWLVVSTWRYVATASDAAQQAHWEQMRGLFDAVTAIVLLVLGTLLGSALQSRWTTSARAHLRVQTRNAAEQHAAAVANAEAARRNAAAALAAGTDLVRALELLETTRPLLQGIEQLASERDHDRSQFVAVSTVASATKEPHLSGYRLDRTGDLRLAEVADESVDRRVSALAVRAGAAGDQITAWLVRRR